MISQATNVGSLHEGFFVGLRGPRRDLDPRGRVHGPKTEFVKVCDGFGFALGGQTCLVFDEVQVLVLIICSISWFHVFSADVGFEYDQTCF